MYAICIIHCIYKLIKRIRRIFEERKKIMNKYNIHVIHIYMFISTHRTNTNMVKIFNNY